jgi:hypothetical protein
MHGSETAVFMSPYIQMHLARAALHRYVLLRIDHDNGHKQAVRNLTCHNHCHITIKQVSGTHQCTVES